MSLKTYVMGLRTLEILYFFQCGDRLHTSVSGVYRRQIPTYKDGLRTKKVLNQQLWCLYYLVIILSGLLE